MKMDLLKNTRQLYCCCGCSLRVGCILIACIELCYPILMVCNPVQQHEGVIAFTFLLYISSSIMLLVGSIKESQKICFIWVIYRTVVMFLTFTGLTYQMHEVHQKYEEKARLITFFLICMIFYFAVNGYFWTIVYSYYSELKEKNRRESRVPPPVHSNHI